MATEREFLLPGDYRATRRPKIYATLLGSCVSVCLRNKHNGQGAMNHFMLAEAPGPNVNDRGRYGDLATRSICDVLFRVDDVGPHYAAKLFGGAAVVSHLGAGGAIGSKNVQAARAVLKEYNIPVVSEDVGGTSGRRINFDTGTGQVEVRKVRKSEEASRLEERRRDLAARNVRVLIVDDSALVRRILRQAIEESNGVEICGEAPDSYQARDLVLSTNPDVVCLDIIMPGLNGLQFLKKLSQHYPLPVVICSTIAKAGSDIAARARQYGAVDVVDKDELKLYEGMETVRQYLIPKLRGAVGKVPKRSLFQKA
jgi:two-component system chemotaxis response regulator CheB